ncbi:uncharacterized protein LOC103504888 [Diaphorina citri]|uniref:Uncharacterized protein LOC103504888 n=1 Tax=Diaphorina citri TaxID=121845 RepID=A0A3Q0IJ12_DIACI|nr:uncharacterized protein LOC103504888 [Diaphorina citri]
MSLLRVGHPVETEVEARSGNERKRKVNETRVGLEEIVSSLDIGSLAEIAIEVRNVTEVRVRKIGIMVRRDHIGQIDLRNTRSRRSTIMIRIPTGRRGNEVDIRCHRRPSRPSRKNTSGHDPAAIAAVENTGDKDLK